MILRSEFDFAGSLEVPLGFLGHLEFLVIFAVLVSPVEADRRFQNQENVVARPLDLPDRLCDSVRLGKGIVDRVSQFLHEML